MRRFSDQELHAIRNEISIRLIIERHLKLPCKESEGVFRFLCPMCNEFQTGVNPKTNLGRCFRCRENFNTIEIVMKDKRLSFVESVKFITRLFGGSIAVSAAPPPDRGPVATSTASIS
jgi:DNA primase